jgi:hypothetical protein
MERDSCLRVHSALLFNGLCDSEKLFSECSCFSFRLLACLLGLGELVFDGIQFCDGWLSRRGGL